jgi:hypothetical protein
MAARRIRTAAPAAVSVEVPGLNTALRPHVDQFLTDDIQSTSNQNGVATTQLSSCHVLVVMVGERDFGSPRSSKMGGEWAGEASRRSSAEPG